MARLTERRLRPSERRVETERHVGGPYSWCDSFHVEGFTMQVNGVNPHLGDLFLLDSKIPVR